jgi:hypothetical protein
MRSTALLLILVAAQAALTVGEERSAEVQALDEEATKDLSGGDLGEAMDEMQQAGPPPQTMLGTSGHFRLGARSDVPKMDEEEMDLGEGAGVSTENLSLSEAATLLWAQADTAPSGTKVSKAVLDQAISKAPKPAQEGHIVEAVHEGDAEEHGLDLGEAAGVGVRGAFRYTNGEYGGDGGKKKWLKCVTPCKGFGFGGYGYCFTKGANKPWGGCMAPGSDPAEERPPKLYTKNHIATSNMPRAHMFCKDGDEMWIKNGAKLVPVCSACKNDDYFLVPNQHVKNMMVGTCFKIEQYGRWVKAVAAAMSDETAPMSCSIFTNAKGMTSKYFGGKNKDAWHGNPKKSRFNPRGFVCTTTSELKEHSVSGLLQKGYRQLRVFSSTIARFVMCYTDSPDKGSLKCVKKKRMGKCSSFFMRNAAFDSSAFHVPSVTGNRTNVDWKAATKAWDRKAVKLGTLKLTKGSQHAMSGKALGMNPCNHDWNERILAMH